MSPTSKSCLWTDLSHPINNEVIAGWQAASQIDSGACAEEQAAPLVDVGASDYQPFLDVIDEMCGLECRLQKLKKNMLSSGAEGCGNGGSDMKNKAVVLVPSAELKEKA